MNVDAVRTEIGSKVDKIVGLRVFTFDVGKVQAPGAIVGLPDRLDFDQTYGRGSDALSLPLWVMVARSSDRVAGKALAAFLAGSGPQSVKAAVDSKRLSNEYTSCDTVTVTAAETGSYTSGGVEMLGVEFTVTVTGSGS